MLAFGEMQETSGDTEKNLAPRNQKPASEDEAFEALKESVGYLQGQVATARRHPPICDVPATFSY